MACTVPAATTDGCFAPAESSTMWREIGRLEGHAGPPTGVEFTPDGARAVSVSVDGSLIVWDVARQALRRLSGHGEGLWSLAISPGGRTVLSDSADTSMILFDLETGQAAPAASCAMIRQKSPEQRHGLPARRPLGHLV